MKHLDEESIEKLTQEIAKIEKLTSQGREELIGEFLIDLKKEKRRLKGGEGAAKEILTKTFGKEKAERILEKLSPIDVDKEFTSLAEIGDEALVSFLKDEHPQTIAVALSFLPPEKSAAILKALGPETVKEVVLRMAKMDKVMPDAVAGIVKTIKKRYKEYQKKSQGLSAGGLDTLTDILRHMDPENERKIMRDLEINLPEVSRQIQEKTFAFENIVYLTNNEIRIIIDEIRDDRLIAMALKGSGDDVRFKFLRNMSQNRATDVLMDMDAMGSVRLSEVEDCRRQIVSIMKSLDENGVISLKRGDDIYVK
ncbi:MAG: flagellar motor switch protein FliG [Spirochaetes bacterium RBG_16_49_21]|nr:MAG: flagellar motor switch protein FliG [Spirochaetes bacterium RBG_16_49_21]